jgi:hypothetical protein
MVKPPSQPKKSKNKVSGAVRLETLDAEGKEMVCTSAGADCNKA